MRRNPLFTLLFILPFILTLVPAYATSGPIRIDQPKILRNAPGLNPEALNYAVRGYQWAFAHDNIRNPNILTVIDFNLPSSAKRVWVLNLKTSKVLMHVHTTQGKNSGTYYARYFSNRPGSDETSLGIYLTLNTYNGKHGLSERLDGLEPGINNNVYRREIVVHPAWYASSSFVEEYHRTGDSWGCFGINPAVSSRFIALTKGGSVIFAYATRELSDQHLAHI